MSKYSNLFFQEKEYYDIAPFRFPIYEDLVAGEAEGVEAIARNQAQNTYTLLKIAKQVSKKKKISVKEALDIFFDVRKVPGLKKKPSTSELVDWLKLLMADDLPDEILKNRDPSKAIPPLYGALVKNEQDVQLLERLAFMTRREGNNQS